MRVLYITGRRFKFDAKSGGERVSLRNFQMIQEICGEKNTFLCMFSNEKFTDLPPNAKIFPTKHNKMEMFFDTISGRNVCGKRTMNEAIKYIKSLDIDMIFVDHSIIGVLIEKCDINIPIMVYFHNIEKIYAWNRVVHEGLLYLIAYFSFRKNEKKIVELANSIVLINKRDEIELEQIYGKTADFIIPVSFKDEFNEKKVIQSVDSRVNLLFVGSLFRPNYEGLVWFVDEVMGALDSEKYYLTIVGKDLEKKKVQLERNNVTVIGTVDDLGEYYYQADAVVIPIFYGSGMKVKTAEAMMYGKRIFATKEALEGYGDVGECAISECNSKEEFVNNIVKFGNESERKKYYDNTRKYFLNNYSEYAVKEEFRNAIESCANQHSRKLQEEKKYEKN